VTTLRPTVFRGDDDVPALLAFFGPSHHFDGDARWTFGTSLMSAYVNTFEFMNRAPLMVLWRDEVDQIGAVSRLSFGIAEWFHQALPAHRTADTTAMLIEHADAAMNVVSDQSSWRTVRYSGDQAGIDQLVGMGYEPDGADEVFMTRSLASLPDEPLLATDVTVRLLRHDDAAEIDERAVAQVSAFSDGPPTAEALAWIRRSLPHQLRYSDPVNAPHVVAVHPDGRVLAFADTFLDRQNRIGEFEPVGTRPDAQQRGFAKAVLWRALHEMQQAGMTQAVVRTGIDNAAAIAAYESVGFEITDRRRSLRKARV